MQRYYNGSRRAIPEDDGRSLLAKDQYEHELGTIERLSPSEERRIADLARSGNQVAVTMLVENCLRYTYFLAIKYARQFNSNALDAVQAASVAVLEHLPEALKARNTCAFLNVVARCGAFRYCLEDGIIRVPKSSYYEGKRAPLVVSLTLPLCRNEDKTLLDVFECADWQEAGRVFECVEVGP